MVSYVLGPMDRVATMETFATEQQYDLYARGHDPPMLSMFCRVENVGVRADVAQVLERSSIVVVAGAVLAIAFAVFAM